MTMSNREHLLSLAVLTALVAFSTAARADDYSLPNTDQFARLETGSQPMTCAQATAFAWFTHQMELSDGGSENTVSAPAECERTYVAAKGEVSQGDREVYEESK
jgi:hypothetical protein